MPNPPFFVVGTSRSGTTMFRLMLNTHSRLSIPGETWFLIDLMDCLPLRGVLDPDQVESARSIVCQHWRWQEWGVDETVLQDSLADLREPTLADVIEAVYAPTVDGDSERVRWGDKTPGYATELPRLHRVFPRAQFIHLIRDGRDVCLSLKKTGWHGDATWTIAEYWATAVGRACKTGRSLPPDLYMEVRYEDLVLETESVLNRVCKFLRVDFEPEMLSFHESARQNIPGRAMGHLSKTRRPPRRSDVGRWSDEQGWLQTAIFEAFAGDVLEGAGYERATPPILWPIRGVCRAAEFAARSTLPLRQRLGLHFPGWRKSL